MERTLAQERELIRQLKKGSQEAYCRFFDLYAERLLRLAYVLTAHTADAEDIVQVVMLNLVKSIRSGGFQSKKGSLEGYLKASVRNRCIDRLRRIKAWHVPLDDNVEGPQEALIDKERLSFQRIDENRMEQTIQDEIMKLPDMERTAVALRFLDEQSYLDIANEMGITVDHVRNLLGRARKKLRDALQTKTGALST